MELTLAAGETLRLPAPRGLELLCQSGHLWITEEAQPDDVWLAAGQRVRLVGEGLAVVEAKGPARLRVIMAACTSCASSRSDSPSLFSS
jgi:hypothetical protein